MDRPEIVVADITTLEVDAIVNAANARLAPGGGVCGAIHRAAGSELARACADVGPCDEGDARITPGFRLPARFVIHAVGPVYEDGSRGEGERLASAYRRSLQLAHERGLRSIAFPCISTGVFGYPRQEAAKIALREMNRWLSDGREPRRIICCCFHDGDAAIYRDLMVGRANRRR